MTTTANDPESPHDRVLAELVAPASWTNPDPPSGRYNLVVLGAGTAGLVCAAGAAGLGAKVALVEKKRLGGDCLNDGCVPSKAILRAARAAAEARSAASLGVNLEGPVSVDFEAVMERMRRLRAEIARNDSAERFRALGVDVYFGHGAFTGPDTLAVGGKTLRFARAVIATGARARIPDIPGIDRIEFHTNESIFNLKTLPNRLIVLGAGPIGAELAQAFRRFGSKVRLVNRSARFLPKEEPAAAEVVRRALENDGVIFDLGVKFLSVEASGGLTRLIIERNGNRETLEADALLVATGRAVNLEGIGLETAGVPRSQTGLQINDYLQTTNKNIYAAGDVCEGFQFTHAADAMARIVLRNALFFGRAKASKLVIPWCTYTDPELAHVGLTTAQAAEQGIAFDVFTQPFGEVDRAVLDGRTEGHASVLVRKGTDEVLGATIVAPNAGDIIAAVSLAMTQRLGLKVFASTILPYPTQAEALKKLGDAFMKTKLTPSRRGALANDPEMAAPTRTGLKTQTFARLAIVAIAVFAMVGFYASGVQRRLSWGNLRESIAPIRDWVDPHPLASATAFAAIYAGATALSLPIATPLTLAAGAVFGRVLGTVVASLGSTIGATLAMLAGRYVLADRVRARFGERLKTLDEGVARDGPYYLFLLRLVPAFPFVLINLGMGLTRMRVVPYAITSAAGMLPATILYVNAGAELAAVETPAQILSPRVLASFAILGLAPLLVRKALGRRNPSDIRTH